MVLLVTIFLITHLSLVQDHRALLESMVLLVYQENQVDQAFQDFQGAKALPVHPDLLGPQDLVGQLVSLDRLGFQVPQGTQVYQVYQVETENQVNLGLLGQQWQRLIM